MRSYVTGSLTSTVRKALPKKMIQYYRGYLYVDRMTNESVDALAREAWKLYRKGRVHLLQRKNGDFDYSYYIVKR